MDGSLEVAAGSTQMRCNVGAGAAAPPAALACTVAHCPDRPPFPPHPPSLPLARPTLQCNLGTVSSKNLAQPCPNIDTERAKKAAATA
jgi:hypothetical protein